MKMSPLVGLYLALGVLALLLIGIGAYVVSTDPKVALPNESSKRHDDAPTVQKANGDSARATSSPSDRPTETAQPTAKLPLNHEDKSDSSVEQENRGTGVKEDWLIGFLNLGSDEDKHNFVVLDVGPPGFRLYQDEKSDLMLIVGGPPSDLTLIEFIIDYNAFIGTTSTGIDARGAVALANCVRRMGRLIDSENPDYLHSWLKSNLALVVEEDEGAITARGNTGIVFRKLETAPGRATVIFMVAVPEGTKALDSAAGWFKAYSNKRGQK